MGVPANIHCQEHQWNWKSGWSMVAHWLFNHGYFIWLLGHSCVRWVAVVCCIAWRCCPIFAVVCSLFAIALVNILIYFIFIRIFYFAEDPNERLEGYNQRTVGRVSEIFQAFWQVGKQSTGTQGVQGLPHLHWMQHQGWQTGERIPFPSCLSDEGACLSC